MAGSNWERLYKMPFAKGYAGLVAKAEKKGRSKAEVDEVVRWLTGFAIGAATSWMGWQAGKRPAVPTAGAMQAA